MIFFLKRVYMPLVKKSYYHGSATEIKDDALMPKEQWNSVQNARVKGAFVTSDKNYAKFFAIVRCVSGRGQIQLHNKKIYIERLSKHIKPNFYVYTVYEMPDAPFIHDKGKEYYSECPIKIAKREKYDTAVEIKKLGYEVYVLNTCYDNAKTTQGDNNYDKQNYMNEAIRKGEFHRVNIVDLLKRQATSDLKRGTNKLRIKIGNISRALQSIFGRE